MENLLCQDLKPVMSRLQVLHAQAKSSEDLKNNAPNVCFCVCFVLPEPEKGAVCILLRWIKQA